MIKRTLLAAAAACAIAVPAAAQDVTIANATVATGDGSEPIENGHVVVRGGRVLSVGAGAPAAGGTAIDAEGRWVTPGLFATVTTLGLSDVGAVSESNDTQASDSPFSAALDAAPAINPSSQHILVHRAAGVTRAASVTMPASSIFGGQGAIIDLGADPQAVVRPRAFQVVALGESGARLAGGSRTATHALLRNALREATQFGEDASIPGRAARPADIRTGDDLPIDPRMAGDDAVRGDDVLLTRFDAAALVPVVRGEQPLYVAVERASDGLDDLPENFEELASTQSNIGRMVAAGVKVAINAAAMENPRNLNQYAGSLVALSRVPGASGLSWGQAFAAISSIPAEISGMGGRAGVLSPNAVGDLVIWDGDPLELGAMPVQVFIDGVEQPLDNHQSRLKERYRDLDESTLPKAYDW